MMNRSNRFAQVTGCLALLAMLSLAACGGGGSSSGGSSSSDSGGGGGGGGITEVLLEADSGTDRSADGTWIACYNDNTREEHFHSGATMRFRYYAGTTTTTFPCAGGTLTDEFNMTVTAFAPVTMTGWLNGMGDALVAAPARASGSGNLAPIPVVTRLTVTGDLSGTPSFYVDDSTATYKMWRSGDGTACPQVGGNDVCMSAVDPLIKN